MVIHLSRFFLDTGTTCAVCSRYQISCALCWLATNVPPCPGAETSPMALEAAETKATTVRAGASCAYREIEATRILVCHVLDLLLSYNILQTEYCAMLHGASQRVELGSAECQPRTGAGAAGMGKMVSNPAGAGNSSVGTSSSGAVSSMRSPGMDGGASAGGADQQPSPSGGKDSSLSKGRSGSGRVDTLTGQVAAARAAVATGAWG